MKRLIISLFGLALMCFGGVGFAQNFKNGIASGGFCVIESNYGQGYGEWNFPILTTEKGFILRDCVTMGGFGGTVEQNIISIGGFTVGNKFLMGGMYTTDSFRIRSYGLFGVDFSMFSTVDHPFYSPSDMMATLTGGGFEFQYSECSSFVIEYGGKFRYVIGKDMNNYKKYNEINPTISFGYRGYY